MKTPKKELKALLNLAKECLEQPDSVVCKEYKGKILDACPSLKKEDEVLEIGQWYNYDWGHASGLFFITKFDNKKVKGYGFLENKWHDNRNDVTYMGHNTYGDWKKADPKKVEELLIKEAKKRGYKDGNYKCLHNGTYTHSDEYTYDSKENSLFSGWFDNRRNVIFQKGKWAEIIETISLSEAEKILKEKLNKDVKIKID